MLQREIKIYGKCLEDIGIINPNRAIVDYETDIKIGDIVHCRKVKDSLNSYIKRVIDYNNHTGKYIVGTHYLDKTKDFTFETDLIHGVVIKIFDNGGCVVYERKEN